MWAAVFLFASAAALSCVQHSRHIRSTNTSCLNSTSCAILISDTYHAQDEESEVILPNNTYHGGESDFVLVSDTTQDQDGEGGAIPTNDINHDQDGQGDAIPTNDTTQDQDGEGGAIPTNDINHDRDGQGDAIPTNDTTQDQDGEGGAIPINDINHDQDGEDGVNPTNDDQANRPPWMGCGNPEDQTELLQSLGWEGNGVPPFPAVDFGPKPDFEAFILEERNPREVGKTGSGGSYVRENHAVFYCFTDDCNADAKIDKVPRIQVSSMAAGVDLVTGTVCTSSSTDPATPDAFLYCPNVKCCGVMETQKGTVTERFCPTRCHSFEKTATTRDGWFCTNHNCHCNNANSGHNCNHADVKKVEGAKFFTDLRCENDQRSQKDFANKVEMETVDCPRSRSCAIALSVKGRRLVQVPICGGYDNLLDWKAVERETPDLPATEADFGLPPNSHVFVVLIVPDVNAFFYYCFKSGCNEEKMSVVAGDWFYPVKVSSIAAGVDMKTGTVCDYPALSREMSDAVQQFLDWQRYRLYCPGVKCCGVTATRDGNVTGHHCPSTCPTFETGGPTWIETNSTEHQWACPNLGYAFDETPCNSVTNIPVDIDESTEHEVVASNKTTVHEEEASNKTTVYEVSTKPMKHGAEKGLLSELGATWWYFLAAAVVSAVVWLLVAAAWVRLGFVLRLLEGVDKELGEQHRLLGQGFIQSARLVAWCEARGVGEAEVAEVKKVFTVAALALTDDDGLALVNYNFWGWPGPRRAPVHLLNLTHFFAFTTLTYMGLGDEVGVMTDERRVDEYETLNSLEDHTSVILPADGRRKKKKQGKKWSKASDPSDQRKRSKASDPSDRKKTAPISRDRSNLGMMNDD